MKKLLSLLVVAGTMFIVACGPSAEEQAAEQARLDSLMQDSIAKAAEAQRVADSIAAAGAKKGGKKGK